MRPLAFLILFSSVAIIEVTQITANAAPVPKHLMKEPENNELVKLQGEWKLESLKVGNAEVAQLDIKMEFREDKMIITGAGQTTTSKVKFDSVDGIKRLTTSESRAVNANGAPGAKQEDGSFGYTIDGDKLTIAVALNGAAPTIVDPTNPTKDAIVIVLARMKEKN
jgi:uncharacterized protein (TIGR03067 family)